MSSSLYMTVDDDREIAFSLVVLVYGDPEYPFVGVEQHSLYEALREVVQDQLLPGQEARIHTSVIDKKGDR